MRARIELSTYIRRIEFTESVKRRLIDDMKDAVDGVQRVQREIESLTRQLNPRTRSSGSRKKRRRTHCARSRNCGSSSRR